jgi:transposase-like protein
MASILSAKHFHDERAAYAFVEARVWANGRVCPHCGVVDNSTALKGASTRIGVYKCKEKACRKPFTVKVGTVFEASNVKLHIWLQAMHLLCSSKKGISTNQLHRTLGVTLKTAWFMGHRVREAMRGGELAPFGAGGTHVEVDETFLLKDPDAKPPRKPTRSPNWDQKMKVLTLVDRASGRARSFVVDSLKAADLAPILSANIAKEARLLTDEAPRYISLGRMFADHQSVNHGKEEYVRMSDPVVHTNTVENYYSVFKRGMRGTYQHCAKRHLHRYMAEFDFRYSNRVALGVGDVERADKALGGVVGKRLKYRDSRPW